MKSAWNPMESSLVIPPIGLNILLLKNPIARGKEFAGMKKYPLFEIQRITLITLTSDNPVDNMTNQIIKVPPAKVIGVGIHIRKSICSNLQVNIRTTCSCSLLIINFVKHR